MIAATVDHSELRALDEWISEHVMGWTVVAREEGRATLFSPYGSDSRTLARRWSRYIASAFEVLERCRANGDKVGISNRPTGAWGCWIGRHVGTSDERTAFETADTTAEAICLAVRAAYDVGGAS